MNVGVITLMKPSAPSYFLRYRSMFRLLEESGALKAHEIVKQRFFGRGHDISLRDPLDMLFIARVNDSSFVKTLRKRLRGTALPVLFELDDLILYERRREARVEEHESLAALIAAAQCVVASTPYLAEQLRDINARTVVFPNLLDPLIWNTGAAPAPRGKGSLSVCCVGTNIMSENLSLVLPAIERCASRYGQDVLFTLWGKEKHLDRKVRALKNVRVCGDKLDYPRYAARFQQERYSIGIAPLSGLRFNRAKSAIKYMEFAVSGTAPLLSDIEAYNSVGTPASRRLVPNDPDAWTEAICALIEDERLRDSICRSAWEDVTENHVLTSAAAARYRSLLEQIAGA